MKKGKGSDRFPDRIYTYDEVRLARAFIDKGYRHRLRIIGSTIFREKTRKALKLVKTAGHYEFLRTYIGGIRQIEGLSQLREAEASIWANAYAVDDQVEAACFFVQKAWQMKDYIEDKAYYGHIGETKAVEVRRRFLETLEKRTKNSWTREECRRKMELWSESKFL